MSASSEDGKILRVRVAKPGEVLGLSATLTGKPYELTAQAAEPCQVSFIKRNDYLRFLREYPDACFKLTEALSEKYHLACQEMRWLGLSRTVEQKLARLLLQWSDNGTSRPQLYVDLTLTHEEIAQVIGTTRETVKGFWPTCDRRRSLVA
jgi:CRP/FNR family transcriptional regulator, cyclic AMP receptor protein